MCGCTISCEVIDLGDSETETETEVYEEIPAPSKGDIASQTTLMYFMGTSLKNYFNDNINWAADAVATGAMGDGRLLVFWLTSYGNGQLFEIYRSSTADESTNLLIKEYEGSSGFSLTEANITEVIADVKEYAPSSTYNIILSGHGTGWVSQSHPSLKSLSVVSDFVDWDAMSSEDAPIVTRFLGSSSDGYMEISELKSALEQSQTKFGYILFDACFMSNIESLYDLKDLCNYIIGSPCEILGPGFPYTTVLPELFVYGGSSVNYSGVVQAYYDFYSEYSYPSGCIAVAVTSEFDGLADIIKRINESSPNSVDVYSLQQYERLSNPVFLDLEQYVLALCSDATLKAEFEAQFDKAFPEEWRLHTNKFYANIGVSSGWMTINYYSGVSTSAPSSMFRDDWYATQWAIDTGAN